MNTDAINYIFGIIGTILGIVGIILTVRSIKKKEPVFSIKSINIISNYASLFDHLTVSYKGERVENFTVSAVLFFNRGVEALDGDDIARLNPLRIIGENCNILNSQVLAVNNPSSGFTANFDKIRGTIDIAFDYLNHNDGAVVSIIHTGISSQNIDVVGDMKEVKGLRRVPTHLMKIARPINFRNVVAGAALVLLAFISAFGLLVTFLNFEGLLWGAAFYVGSLSIVVLIVGLGRFITLSRSTTIPRGLEIFDSDYHAFPDRG